MPNNRHQHFNNVGGLKASHPYLLHRGLGFLYFIQQARFYLENVSVIFSLTYRPVSDY